MGNTQCGRCLVGEKEKTQEIALGKDVDNKGNKIDKNSAIKNISEEMPNDYSANKYENEKEIIITIYIQNIKIIKINTIQMEINNYIYQIKTQIIIIIIQVKKKSKNN